MVAILNEKTVNMYVDYRRLISYFYQKRLSYCVDFAYAQSPSYGRVHTLSNRQKGTWGPIDALWSTVLSLWINS